MDALTDEDVSKQISQQIGNLSVKNDVLTICASCGKEGNDLNVCDKCDLAAYCNAACKKKHRTKHKKKCEKRAAELHDDELYSNSLRRRKIARSVCCHYHRFIQGINTIHVVGKLFAVDVFMQLH